MYAINMGDGSYAIHNRNLQIDTKLPPAVYRINCAEQRGFYLEMMPEIRVYEKIYGKINKKIDMIIDSYEKSKRSLGAIFSGDKGLGKSLAAMRICEIMLDKGLPVLVVDKAIRGTAQFIQSIEQECVVFFDEYDKIFTDNGGMANQSTFVIQQCSIEMLGLFDGIDRTKRLYIVTCNEIFNISQYLLNRPGRFHYHIKFTYPTKEDVKAYLLDNLKNTDPKYIEKVVKFTLLSMVNFDGLRAICFELNNGHDFEDIIESLNIYNTGNGVRCNASGYTTDGRLYNAPNILIYPTGSSVISMTLYSNKGQNVSVSVPTKYLELDIDSMTYKVTDLSKIDAAYYQRKKGGFSAPDSVKFKSLEFEINPMANRGNV